MEIDLSLKNNVNAIDKINDIRLSLKSKIGSDIIWILVEGEDDCKIYPKFFDINKARVEYVNGGKIELEKALTTLIEETEQVIGIQDADFLHLEKRYPNIKNLFYTDYHDIEMTMLSFEDVLENLFSEIQIQDKAKMIKQNAIEASSYIAYIRWYNEINHCNIKFSGIGYGEDVINIVDCKANIKYQELLNKLNNCSHNKTEILTVQNINDFIANKSTPELFNLCNGHDVSKLMTLLTISIIKKNFSHEKFTSLLRASFNIHHFAQTTLYSKIYDWQVQKGHYILKGVA